MVNLLRTAWPVAAFIFTGQVHANEITGDELLHVCIGTAPASQLACDNHIAAARVQANVAIASLEQQAGREPFSACVRVNLDNVMFRGMVLLYLQHRPEWRQLAVSEVTTRVLLTAYPCN